MNYLECIEDLRVTNGFGRDVDNMCASEYRIKKKRSDKFYQNVKDGKCKGPRCLE